MCVNKGLADQMFINGKELKFSLDNDTDHLFIESLKIIQQCFMKVLNFLSVSMLAFIF